MFTHKLLEMTANPDKKTVKTQS